VRLYWRERDGVRALICVAGNRRLRKCLFHSPGGVSPMPDRALNLAGFNEDDAENIYEIAGAFSTSLLTTGSDRLLASAWD